MDKGPAEVRREIEATRGNLDSVIEELEERVDETADRVRRKLSVKRFIHEHRTAVGIAVGTLVGSSFITIGLTVWTVRKIRRSFPVRLYRAIRKKRPRELFKR